MQLAAAGECVLVTDHGRVVAQLGPPPQWAEAVSDAALAQAVREGLITPAAPPHDALLPAPPAAMISLRELLANLDQSRADR